MQHPAEVVAIDGPCGVGKSVVAHELAHKLGFRHLDTGAMYRAIARLALRSRVDLRDGVELGRLAESAQLRMDIPNDHGETRIWCNGEEVTKPIRERDVNLAVSEVADCEGVRRALVRQQRAIGLLAPSVLEGRDIATVVFPDARWKFFLEAELEIRAQRRLAQAVAAGRQAQIERVRKDLADRDHRDRTRPWGALRLAPDAVVVDTSRMDKNQVVDLLAALVLADKAGARP